MFLVAVIIYVLQCVLGKQPFSVSSNKFFKKNTAKIHLSKSAYVRELNIHYYKRLSRSSAYGVCMTEDENYTSRANF